MYKRSNHPKWGFKHPGWGYQFAICDICGIKLRRKDGTLVNEQYSRDKGLFVCHECYSPVHPQDLPYPKPSRPRKLDVTRPEQDTPAVIITDPNNIFTGEGLDGTEPNSRVPDAPCRLRAVPTAGGVLLRWYFDGSPGSFSINGFKVERETTIGGGFVTIVENTDIADGYWVDEDVSPNTVYNYRVSAINLAGAGAASNEDSTTTGA